MKFIITLIIIMIVFVSCKSKMEYENKDLILKFVNENKSKFKGFNDYYLVCFRDLKLECAQEKCGYDPDYTTIHLRDSLKDEQIFIITDNDKLLFSCQFVHISKNFHYLRFDYNTLNRYGFKFQPHVFHIKNNNLISWKPLTN